MTDTTAPSRVLNVPELPPEEWFTDDPEWYVDGAKVTIRTHGPDEGRVCGLVQPAPGQSRYMAGKNVGHVNQGKPVPDARRYPDGFASMNVGLVDVIAAEGGTRQIAAGRVSMRGGHAADAVGATTLSEAMEFLNRDGRFAHLGDDIGIIGRADAVTEGPHAGAVIIRGMAVPGMTQAEAFDFNTTTVSGENWPSPQHGNQLVFAGLTRVDRTAFPYPIPHAVAAEATADPALDAAGVTGYDVECVDGTCFLAPPPDDNPGPDAHTGPVAASVDVETQATIVALTAAVEGFSGRLDEIEAELATVSVHVFGPSSIVDENDQQAVMARLEQLDQKINEAVAALNNRPTPDTSSDPQTRTNPPTGADIAGVLPVAQPAAAPQVSRIG